MKPIGLFAGGSGSVLAGLGTCLNTKKNCLDTVYSYNASYKKTRKTIAGNVVDLSVDSLSLGDIGGVGIEPVMSWGSKVNSVTDSVSKLLNVKNMVNMVAEETSYAESDENNDIDETTSRKTHTHTYMLGNLPKQPLFNYMSDNDSEQVLFFRVVLGFNKLLLLKSHAPKKQSFNLSKSFILDIELLAVSDKTIGDKLICVKKIFYRVNGFGGASTPSKFLGIIRSSFTLESSLKKAKKLAISEKILVNDEIRKVNSRSDQEVIIKEIPVDFPKLAVESVFSKFGRISVSIEKNSVQVVKTVGNKQLWISRDQHRTLLYTLPVGITVHNLSSLLDLYGRKTCFIGHNSNSYVHDKCAVVCFADEASKLAVIGSVPVFKVGGNFSGSRKQVVTDQDRVYLAGIYKKKQAPIACPVSFVPFSISLFLVAGTFIFASVLLSDYGLYGCLVSLEYSLKLLANQISGILKKLGSIELVPPVVAPVVFSPMVPVSVVSSLDINMVLDSASVIFASSSQVINNTTTGLSSSSFKVLTTKIGGLEFKMMALKVLVESILDKLDHLCSGLGTLAPSTS
ncbi:hypothetical protein G9A89_004765 [Geosiphon pyriformis]|nr:hypothetical protein G9A89_004765 [Geosiphon pyriformis]